MILLDTQVVVRTATDDPRLGFQARAAIEAEADRRASTMVAWEIATHARSGRFAPEMPATRWITLALAHLDARDMPVARDIARDAGDLPDDVYGDPGDRIMIAIARTLDCPSPTPDRAILRCAATG